jgi:hypothetical protein
MVGFNIPLRFIFKPSYSRNSLNTNVGCNAYIEKRMISRTTLILTLVFINLTIWGQGIDSASIDLKRLTDLDFFKKYSVVADNISSTAKQDFKITKLIWSLGQVRETDRYLRQKGVPTVTMIVERPTKENKFYAIGHYQLPTKDHMTRMAFYRVDTLQNKIDYQNLDDFLNDKWKKVR